MTDDCCPICGGPLSCEERDGVVYIDCPRGCFGRLSDEAIDLFSEVARI